MLTRTATPVIKVVDAILSSAALNTAAVTRTIKITIMTAAITLVVMFTVKAVAIQACMVVADNLRQSGCLAPVFKST